MHLATGIARNTSLHSITFCDSRLNFKALANALKDNKTLKEVELRQSNRANSPKMIDEEAIQALKESNQNIAFIVSV